MKIDDCCSGNSKKEIIQKNGKSHISTNPLTNSMQQKNNKLFNSNINNNTNNYNLIRNNSNNRKLRNGDVVLTSKTLINSPKSNIQGDLGKSLQTTHILLKNRHNNEDSCPEQTFRRNESSSKKSKNNYNYNNNHIPREKSHNVLNPRYLPNIKRCNITGESKVNEFTAKTYHKMGKCYLINLSKNLSGERERYENNNYYFDNNDELIKNQQNYTFVIRPENCGYLVRKCFEHRINWKENTDLTFKNFNFKWQQNTKGIEYGNLSRAGCLKQMVNHFEFHSLITNKANLFINLMKYAEIRDENVFKYLPFTILFEYNKDSFFSKIEKFESFFNNIDIYRVNYFELDDHKYRNAKGRLYSLFFPFSDHLGSKTAINIPESHLYSAEEALAKKVRHNLWLIKAPDLNRGMCIKISDNFNFLKRNIRNYNLGISKGYNSEEDKSNNFIAQGNTSNNFFLSKNIYSPSNKDFKNNTNDEHVCHKYKSSIIVIQKYIEKPLLYFGRKFDIRIWVLLTHDMKVYMFNEGHLKCCSIKYNLNTCDDFCHLTNYSFQKYNENFGKYELGNEVSFADLQNNIDINYNKKVDFKFDVIPKIKNIIKFTFQSVKHKINGMNRNYTFEIYGFDFMIDYNFEPFLIEVNLNPGLEESSPLIRMLVPRMLDDALRLTVDKEFGTIYNINGVEKHSNDNMYPYQSPFPVNGYFNSENLFKFVCDLNIDEETNKKINFNKYHINTKKTMLKKSVY